jgi:hypothetical protein
MHIYELMDNDIVLNVWKFYFIHLEPITHIDKEQTMINNENTEDDEQNTKRIMIKCTNLQESKIFILDFSLLFIIFF